MMLMNLSNSIAGLSTFCTSLTMEDFECQSWAWATAGRPSTLLNLNADTLCCNEGRSRSA